jgi:hypothetical protein
MMEVNIKGAAQNNYDGIKALLDFIDEESEENNYESVEDFIYALNDIIVKYQPLLAAYCLLEHINATE